MDPFCAVGQLLPSQYLESKAGIEILSSPTQNCWKPSKRQTAGGQGDERQTSLVWQLALPLVTVGLNCHLTYLPDPVNARQPDQLPGLLIWQITGCDRVHNSSCWAPAASIRISSDGDIHAIQKLCPSVLGNFLAVWNKRALRHRVCRLCTWILENNTFHSIQFWVFFSNLWWEKSAKWLISSIDWH